MRAIQSGLAAIVLTTGACAIELDVNSADSILSASKTIVGNILGVYNENGSGPAIPGLLPDPYYWWEAGYMFDSLINYWSLSGDDSLVNTIQEGMSFQVGPDHNYMPPNQSKSLGNDDQAFWGNAAMTAAERGLPQPNGRNVTWLQLAENVFNSQVLRWNTESCGGGLKWQIFSFNNGYNYRSSTTQGTFASLAARLARFTGNQTYSDWAEKAVTWTRDVGLMSEEGAIFDGTADNTNCSSVNHIQWTINAGLFLTTGAYLTNATSSTSGSDLVTNVFQNANTAFADQGASANSQGRSIITESACQPASDCETDQRAYKAGLARGLSNVLALTASSNDSSLDSRIRAILSTSAVAAAAQCSGGDNGTACGFDWGADEWDGTSGVGQDLSVLEVVLANLPQNALNTANNTAASSTSSNGTTTTSAGGGTSSGTSTETSSAASESSTSGAAHTWSSSAFVSLVCATFIAVMRLSM